MTRCLIAIVKLPVVLTFVLLEIAFGLVGAVLSLLGVALTPVFGIGLLILPFGLGLLLLAWVFDKLH